MAIFGVLLSIWSYKTGAGEQYMHMIEQMQQAQQHR
jgi:hypothetical protein